MAIKYTVEDRRVIPNWRDFKRTVKLKELASIGQVQSLRFNIDNLVVDWLQSPSVGTAADLINSAFIAGKFDFAELKDATAFVIARAEKSSKVLLDLAYNINQSVMQDDVDSISSIIELEVDSISDFETYYENQTIYRILNKTRNLTRVELRNPIIWVDLARLHAFFGNKVKAERAMKTALQLAPDNRFVLRSATRMFIHFEEPEKALFYLRKSAGTPTDPWLISAHIATSSLMDRYSPYIKQGQQALASQNYRPYDLSELSSSLLTLEFSEGSMKKAKKLLPFALKEPNDNSLAQIEWVRQRDKGFEFSASNFQNVTNPFEAFAFDAYEKGLWASALDNCIYWFLDIPYSKRPILLGSFVACMMLKDYTKAVMLCNAGLKANPGDPTLLNNMVYSLIMLDRLDDVQPFLNALTELKFENVSRSDTIAIQATFGLAAFRVGEIAKGQEYYELAIANATKEKDKDLEDLATLIYFRELVRARCTDKIPRYYEHICAINPGDSKIIQFWKRDMLVEYNSTDSSR